MTEQGPAAQTFFDAIRNGNDLAVDTAVAVKSNLLRARARRTARRRCSPPRRTSRSTWSRSRRTAGCATLQVG